VICSLSPAGERVGERGIARKLPLSLRRFVAPPSPLDEGRG
jgi:hypothetical protein